MASTFESFQDLNLSRDEVERIGEALKDKEFRKLLAEYVDEIRDPENRKLYEEEVTQLEKERGMDVKFINPIPGYVIKTSANGTQKAFINVASNEHIGRPTSSPTYQDGHKGLQWSLPHTLSPPREDYDSKRVRCMVYDVVFHPDTIRLGKNNKQFRNLVNSTACDSVEQNFRVKLDQKNLKFPNLQYKGVDHPSIIRTPSKTTQPPKSEEEQKFLDEVFSHIPLSKATDKPVQPNSKTTIPAPADDPRSKYTTPKYVIKQRTLVDMQDYTYDRDSKENVAIPKELLVEVFLPMLKSSEGVQLDVTEKTITITSETPAKYKLNITLPYAVNQELGNAKFEKDCKKLVVTLPVIRNKHFLITDVNSIDDSGVESDHGSPTLNDALIEELEDKSNDSLLQKLISKQENYHFFDSSIDYTLPEHVCQLVNEDVLSFTFKVKNVNSSSIEQEFAGNTTLLIKFTSISTGFFPINYGVILQLSEGVFNEDDVEIEAWDNNVIAQISGVQTNAIKSYFYGSERDHLVEVFLENKTQIIITNGEEMKAEINVKGDQKTIECEDNSLGTGFSDKVRDNNKESDGKVDVLIDNNLESAIIKTDSNESKNADGLISDNKNSANKVNTSKSCNNFDEEESKKLQNHLKKLFSTQINLNHNFNSANFKNKQSEAVNINRAFKDNSVSSSHGSSSPSSSCDEHSSGYGYSCSPVKNRCKGILKQRMRATRSVSESGLDDVVCCIGGSMDIGSCCHSVEEEGDVPEEDVTLAVSVGSTKKTVRFSENISQQLFRSNSSILGQKKKNQRKARNKKRAQERRHSESEICDTSSSAGNVAEINGNSGGIKTDNEAEAVEIGKDTQFDLDM